MIQLDARGKTFGKRTGVCYSRFTIRARRKLIHSAAERDGDLWETTKSKPPTRLEKLGADVKENDDANLYTRLLRRKSIQPDGKTAAASTILIASPMRNGATP